MKKRIAQLGIKNIERKVRQMELYPRLEHSNEDLLCQVYAYVVKNQPEFIHEYSKQVKKPNGVMFMPFAKHHVTRCYKSFNPNDIPGMITSLQYDNRGEFIILPQIIHGLVHLLEALCNEFNYNIAIRSQVFAQMCYAWNAGSKHFIVRTSDKKFHNSPTQWFDVYYDAWQIIRDDTISNILRETMIRSFTKFYKHYNCLYLEFYEKEELDYEDEDDSEA